MHTGQDSPPCPVLRVMRSVLFVRHGKARSAFPCPESPCNIPTAENNPALSQTAHPVFPQPALPQEKTREPAEICPPVHSVWQAGRHQNRFLLGYDPVVHSPQMKISFTKFVPCIAEPSRFLNLCRLSHVKGIIVRGQRNEFGYGRSPLFCHAF